MTHASFASNAAVGRRGRLRRRALIAVGGLLLSATPLISTASFVSADPVETSAARQAPTPPVAAAVSAQAPAGAPDREVGYDVSYPQCPALATTPPSLPSPAAFTIVGVNDGLAYSENACFVQLYRWAQGRSPVGHGDDNGNDPDIAFYANTGNPGPAVSKRWPTGQSFPRACDGSWNVACSYDYGWNAAGYTVDVVDAKLPGGVAFNATWWLDVETANSWNKTDLATNVAALEGFRDRLAIEAPSQTVGFYSTQRQWGLITGATSPGSRINARFADAPNWVAGATESTAPEYCGDTFTGAPVVLVQYVKDGLDHDMRC
ncbi:MAG: hypothetical protein QOJ19_2223 [Acidimicrobiia bacterium]|jgi:hypothetical protein|nr:hypothetical protein [Acidimicrobiia bacterium]